jgi:hypothetical protein
MTATVAASTNFFMMGKGPFDSRVSENAPKQSADWRRY